MNGTEVVQCLRAGLTPSQIRLLNGVLPADLPEADLGGLWAVALGEEGYPASLAASASPPVVLIGRGERNLVAGVAVVGTRNISPLGQAAALAAVEGARLAGTSIISGLAKGCDQAGHEAALQAGVPTIAVVATGVDRVYPAEHADLVERILAAGGSVVSELLPGTPVQPRQLMARNRIISGLCTVMVPCEGKLSSGTMGAVRNQITNGRPVVVAMPKEAGRRLPGAEMLLALAREEGMDPSSLGAKGALVAKISAMGRVAAGVGESPAELSQLVEILHRLSPWS